jgi:hypothetical protein
MPKGRKSSNKYSIAQPPSSSSSSSLVAAASTSQQSGTIGASPSAGVGFTTGAGTGILGGTTTTGTLSTLSDPSSQDSDTLLSYYELESLMEWFMLKNGMYYLAIFMIFGFAIGFMCGNVSLVISDNHRTTLQKPGQRAFHSFVRTVVTPVYVFTKTIASDPIGSISDMIVSPFYNLMDDLNDLILTDQKASKMIFATLREAVIREPGGFVHRDLGILTPAPCGSIRGLGMVNDKYYRCQRTCFPTNYNEK